MPNKSATEVVLLESDMFSDALTASSSKSEVRKKKRRSSTKEDGKEESSRRSEGKEESSRKSEGKEESSKKSERKEESSRRSEGKEESSKESEIKEESKTREVKDESSRRSEVKEESGSKAESSIKKEERIESKKSPPRDSKPLKFYRDTLEDISNDMKKESKDESEDELPLVQRPKLYPIGVLVVAHSSKRRKRSIKWREDNLVSTKYFELDENERVNVTRQNFADMKNMERNREREMYIMHKMEDSGVDKIPWMPPARITIPANKAPQEVKVNSKEVEIQAARQRTVLEAIFFSKSMIPDSPAEADPEYHPMTDPVIIPLDDTTGATDTIHDFSAQGWPEPKPDADADPIATSALPPVSGGLPHFPGYSTYPSYGLPTDNWMPPAEEIKDPGVAYPPQTMPPMFNVNVPPPFAAPGPVPGPMMGPENYPMPMYPNGYNMPRPMYPHGMPPGPPGWGGWTGPRTPMPLDTRNICRAFNNGTCKFGAKCRFLHPGVNCPPLPT